MINGQRLEPLGRWAIGDVLGVLVVPGVLHLTEVRPVEQLLEADDLCAEQRSFAGSALVLDDHRFLVARPVGLQQRGLDDVWHGTPNCSATRR